MSRAPREPAVEREKSTERRLSLGSFKKRLFGTKKSDSIDGLVVIAPGGAFTVTHSTGAGGDQMRSAVLAAFKLMDSDGDAQLSREEVLDGLQRYPLVQKLLQLDPTAPRPLLEQIYANIDANSDGFISQDEFVDYFVPPPRAVQDPIPRYDPRSSGVTAFLLDLDGTIYEPAGILHGAREFYAWLLANKIPHVFLSNTGYKGPTGTQKKLLTPPFAISSEPVPVEHIRTAADAQVDFILDTLPAGSKLFIVSGGGNFWYDMFLSRPTGLKKMQEWTIAESLSDEEVKSWALDAEKLREARDAADDVKVRAVVPRVAIAMFLDHDVQRGETGGAAQGWSYELIAQLTILVRKGADFIYTADDPFNSQHDGRFPGQVFAVPGPGMFAAMLRPAAPPWLRDQFVICGKGGNIGREFMIGRAVQMLLDQGHNGDPDTIMMVGDRYATDVRAAVHIGIRACLVESGCEAEGDQRWYPVDRLTWVASSVDDLRTNQAEAPAEPVGHH